VLLQLFASEGRLKALAGMAIVCFIVKALANVVLIQWLGIVGIVLASAASAASAFAYHLSIMGWDRHVRTVTSSGKRKS
jgi:O-antigen/teichoic acid export membrane protein